MMHIFLLIESKTSYTDEHNNLQTCPTQAGVQIIPNYTKIILEF